MYRLTIILRITGGSVVIQEGTFYVASLLYTRMTSAGEQLHRHTLSTCLTHAAGDTGRVTLPCFSYMEKSLELYRRLHNETMVEEGKIQRRRKNSTATKPRGVGDEGTWKKRGRGKANRVASVSCPGLAGKLQKRLKGNNTQDKNKIKIKMKWDLLFVQRDGAAADQFRRSASCVQLVVTSDSGEWAVGSGQ